MIDGQWIAAITRAAAEAASAVVPLVGRSDLVAIDQAAVDALRRGLAAVPMDGIVVAGEGEKDAAPMLYVGEGIGSGGRVVDIAVDPIDGTKAVAADAPGAMCAVAVSQRGAMRSLGDTYYMDKLVVPVVLDRLSLDKPVHSNLSLLADALGEEVSALRIAVLDRPRNRALMDAVAAAGATCIPQRYTDLDAALAVVTRRGLDALIGIGGGPEGLLAASAACAAGGGVLGRLWRDGAARSSTMSETELVGAESAFCCAAVTTTSVAAAPRRVDGGFRISTLTLVSGDDPVFSEHEVLI